MDHDERAGTEKLNAKIAIADGVHTFARDRCKFQLARHSFAVDGIGGPSQCGRAQWQYVYALAYISQTLAVACKHFKVGETPMREEHWLCPLQMCVPGNDCLAMRFGQIEQRFLG